MKSRSLHLPLLVVTVLAALVAMLPSEVFTNGDAMAMRAGAIRLIEQGRIDVRPAYAERFGDRGQYFYQRESDGRWHSKYGVANTLLFLPPLAFERAWTGTLRPLEGYRRPERTRRAVILALYNIPFAVALAVYLYLLAGLYTESRGVGVAFALVGLFSGFPLYYLRAQTPEIFQILFFTAIAYHVARCRREGPARSVAGPEPSVHAWAAIGFACLLVLQKMPYAWLLPLVAAFLVCADRSEGAGIVAHVKERLATGWTRLLLRFGIPFAATFAWVAWSNHVSFGSVFATGYEQWGDFNDPFGGNLWEGLRGYAVDPQKSLFLHFPMLVLAIFFWRRFLREHPFDGAFLLLAFAPILVVYASTVSWRGNWSFGPRYLVFAAPALSLPLVMMFRAAPTVRRVSLGAAAALLAFCLFLQPMVVLPHFLLPVQVMARFRQVDAKENAYFQRSWFAINRELFAYRAGQPFPPLERARERLPVARTTWLAKEMRQLVVPNLYWAKR